MEWDLWVAAVILEEMSKTTWVNDHFGKSQCRLMTLRATVLTPCNQVVPGNPTSALATSIP